MQWWCSATGLPWSWEWQWYPGVHVLLLVIALGWSRLARSGKWSRPPIGWFLASWITLLATLDWPIGKLGAGYLASVHTLQFLMLTLVVGPCLIMSIPREGWVRAVQGASTGSRFLRFILRPIPALLSYNVIVVATHFPAVVDSAMVTQLGSFAIELSWLAAGLVLWAPIIDRAGIGRLGVFGKILYIFGATVVPTIPAMMMVFSTWPPYRLYELAPRVSVHFTANEDIQLAGLVMKLIGDLPLWIAALVVFFRATPVKGMEPANV